MEVLKLLVVKKRKRRIRETKKRKSSSNRLKNSFKNTIKLLRTASDEDLIELVNSQILSRFLTAIAKPKPSKKGSLYEYFLKNKVRLAIIAATRDAITQGYARKGLVNNHPVFLSPYPKQWYKDGVMLLQGENRFEGHIVLYQNGKVKFAIAARDKKDGDYVGPDDIFFLDIDELKKKGYLQKSKVRAQGAVEELEALLKVKENREEKYQEYFEKYPWAFGMQYKKAQAHGNLNDKRIPDFTGIRMKDDARDILEIKPPFTGIFKSDGNFNHFFNDSWNQAEDYREFAIRESDYLYREKGLRFENPKCYLFIGHNLSEKQKQRLHARERNMGGIVVITYNDLLASVRGTVAMLKRLDLRMKKPSAKQAKSKKVSKK